MTPYWFAWTDEIIHLSEYHNYWNNSLNYEFNRIIQNNVLYRYDMTRNDKVSKLSPAGNNRFSAPVDSKHIYKKQYKIF